MRSRLITLITCLALMLIAATAALAKPTARNSGIVGSVINAPIVPNGLVTGEYPDFVINLDIDMDPSVQGYALSAGKRITITLPDDFPVVGTPTPIDAFDPLAFGGGSWAALLQGWPQVPIFSTWPPGDLTGDVRYTNSLSGTHTLVVTANQDLDGTLSFVPPSPDGPGIKQLHVFFSHLDNPPAGTYEIEIAADIGPNGETMVGTGSVDIAAETAPAIAFTSFFNPNFRQNGIYQEVEVGNALDVPYHLLLWDENGDPLSGVEFWRTGRFATTYNIMVPIPNTEDYTKVGNITVTVPAEAAGAYGGALQWTGPAQDIAAPISGISTTHTTYDFTAFSKPGMYTIEFALDGGNSVKAFINTIERPLTDPGIRTWHGTSYDPVNDIVYVSGGRPNGCVCFYFNDVWAYDMMKQQWMRMGDYTDQLPPEVEFDMSVYDTESEKLVILANGLHTDTVTTIYDPADQTLTQGTLENAPPFRFEPGMVYHPPSDRTVMFGGTFFANSHSDTWLYDTNSDTWEQVVTADAPGARNRMAIDYDSDAELIILHGGGDGFLFSGQVFTDTWAFDPVAKTWTEIATNDGPNLREQLDGAYDASAKKFIVYGMNMSGDYETWAFDYPTATWELRLSSADGAEVRNGGYVGPRVHHVGGMVYSPGIEHVLMYGGVINWDNSFVASDEFWGYSYEDNAWVPSSEFPSPTAVSLQSSGSSGLPVTAVPLMALGLVLALSGVVVLRRRAA